MRPIRIQKAEKNKKQGNRGWIYLLAFLFPVLIFTLGFALKGVYPFGENSALVVDGVHQYTAFYRELSEQLGKGTGWTWSAHAMGYNFAVYPWHGIPGKNIRAEEVWQFLLAVCTHCLIFL